MTELVWDGKYDKDGRRVAPVRIPLPFQTIETINESAQVRAHQLDLFSQGRPSEWRNRLIWGDKKYVLPSLLPEFAAKVNLIYIDPPFVTGADFSFRAEVPDTEETFLKEPSMIEQKAYRDTWGRGLDGYLQWFYETIMLLRELLAEDGSIYVHLDWHVSHYAKALLDEVFGRDRFLNDITWQRTSSHNDPGRFGNNSDHMLLYTVNDAYKWNTVFTPYTDEYVTENYRYQDVDGRRWRPSDMTSPQKDRPNLTYEWKGVTRVWRYTREKMAELERQGRIVYSSTGYPQYKRYLDEMPGAPVQSVWTDIRIVNNRSTEYIGYPTQKPEAFLERIIQASSNEGDLVLDCFCGSGTTAAVAEKLGRRWIAADLGRFAIHTTRKRLLSIANVKPFVVQNLGKYERQAWQVAEFANGDQRESATAQLNYRRFMLDLYRAQPIDGYTWLHGVRDGRLVHVGGVDAPVALGDVQNIVREVWKVRGAGTTNAVDVLGWEFAFEMHEVAGQMASEANVQLRFKRVPREVLEKKAVEQGDIRFFELAALSLNVSQKDQEGADGVERERGSHIIVAIADFTVPPDDVPEDVQRAVTHWSQWIDYWAVDWDFKGDAFHNMAQTYRTRKDPQLQKRLAHTYEQPGTYTIVVKVIDLLGNDTTKSLKVEVR